MVSSPMYLASVPDAPSYAPTSDNSVTTGQYMKIVYGPVVNDGGLPVLSYELQLGSLNLNDFVSLVGGDPYTLQLTFVVTTNITKGELYTFRYRAINQVGFGAWSPIAILQAATVPSPPGMPQYVSSTATTITLSLTQSNDNGGNKIIKHILKRDGGDLSTEINTVVT